MGGCFHALFIAHAFIGKGTYDPRFESSILDANRPWHYRRSGPVPDDPDRTGTRLRLRRGGIDFRRYSVQQTTAGAARRISATLVYTILQRLVETRRVTLQLENGQLHWHRDWSFVRERFTSPARHRSHRAAGGDLRHSYGRPALSRFFRGECRRGFSSGSRHDRRDGGCRRNPRHGQPTAGQTASTDRPAD